MDPQAIIGWLTQQGLQWVRSQRARYRPEARELTLAERTELGRFFTAEYLDVARLTVGAVIEEPPFYPEVQRMGVSLIPFAKMSGITYVDTIFLSEKAGIEDPPPFPLLFHELVHVVQYEVLGLERFLNRYVEGYFEHGQVYEAIPLEAHAYELQRRYESGPTSSFSVGAYVQRMREAY